MGCFDVKRGRRVGAPVKAVPTPAPYWTPGRLALRARRLAAKAERETAAREWNARHPSGTPVAIASDVGGQPFRTHTTGAAYVSASEVAAVACESIPYPVPLWRLKPIV